MGRQFEASAVALVGSYARSDATPSSDVDLVVLMSDPDRALASSDWFPLFGPGVSLTRAKDFGGVQERRLTMTEGHEIEVCIGHVTWADVDPVEAGTAAVVRDGLRPLYDPQGILAKLVAAVDA